MVRCWSDVDWLDLDCPMIAALDKWTKARRGRDCGFFWTRLNSAISPGWEIRYWWPEEAIWLEMGTRNITRTNADFAAIDERRILPPDERP